jgi:alkylation response protein AidB-like acyl-CoA dehydrogenase
MHTDTLGRTGHGGVPPDASSGNASSVDLTPTELTRRTTALAPLVAAYADETERLRRISDPVWLALRETGFLSQFVPKAFGGMATDVDSFIDATLPIAEACASTAWVATFCAKDNWLLAQFPLETQAELWGSGTPYITASAVNSPPGRAVRAAGGLRVTGTWSYGTGISHADWVLAGVMLTEGDGPPQLIGCLFPVTATEVLDTWHADGMAGTGSHDISVADLFVPEARTLAFAPCLAGRGPGSRRYTEPVYSAPLLPFVSATNAVPVLGAARGALRHFRGRLSGHSKPGAEIRQADRPAVQIRLAEADLMVGAAELLVRESSRRAVAAGQLDGPEQISARIAVRAQAAQAVGLCRQAALHLAEGAGSGMHRLEQPFQRIVRDINVMASHFGFDVDTAYELHGRALLGLPPNSPFI